MSQITRNYLVVPR